MSIIFPADRREHWAPIERTCQFCSEVVSTGEVGVFWVGDPLLLLHPPCARSLGTHLIADSREAQLAGGTSPWTERAARVARQAMVAS